MKEQLHDDLLTIAPPKRTGTGTDYVPNGVDGIFWTTVVAPRDLTASALTGALKPKQVWLNGEAVNGTALRLKAGANPLLLYFDKPGAAYFVVATNEIPPAKAGTRATRWWNQPAVLPFDTRPNEAKPVGWYRFDSPPGLRALTVVAHSKVHVWAAGKSLAGAKHFKLPGPSLKPVTVLLRVEPERGN